MQAAPTTLTELREQHEALNLRAEIAELERIVSGQETAARLIEAEFGEIVNRREYLFDTPGWGVSGEYDSRHTSPSDRARGKCSPFFENEGDLARIRGVARFLYGTSEIAIGALENLINYTIGNGLTYKVEAKEEDEAGTLDQIVGDIQECLDQCLERNQWIGDGEVEGMRRAHRDGDAFIWVREYAGWPQVVLVEPDYVVEPIPAREVEEYVGCNPGLEWSFGIASDHRDMERRHAYFIQWDGSKTDWDVAPVGEMVHIRLNVDRGVKRGISDFYAAYLNMERSAKLLGNTLQGAAVQATIAYIKEHVQGTSGDAIINARNAKADYTATLARPGGGSRQVYQKKFLPGTVVETAGTKYHAGPMGQSSAPTYIDVMQAGLRIVGARWAMPEYMISGDASNANYASTLQAGGPFDKATQRRQGLYKRHYAEVCWKMLAVCANRGMFREHGILTLAQLKRAVQIKIEAPAVAVQDRYQEEQIREIRANAGILSKQTWSAQAELDYDVEQANGAKEKVEPSPFGGLPGLPGQIPGQTPRQPGQPGQAVDRRLLQLGKLPEKPPEETKRAAVAAAIESVKTTEEARAVLSEAYP